jgi:arginyl-tRNA synthetase
MKNIQSIITTTIYSLYNTEFSPEISHAPKPELGEYCINIFPLAKTAGKAPPLIAEEVANALAKHTDIFASTSATGGYVNFFLTNSLWMEILESIDTEKKSKNNETIVVDYIGANVGKPLHIGHICTPSIGQTICNVYSYLGYDVIGDSHFGDWGGIFGKLIWWWKYLDLKQIITAEWEEKYNFLDSLGGNREIILSKLLDEVWVSLLLRIYQQFLIIETSNILYHVEREWQARLEFQYLSWVDLKTDEEQDYHTENINLWKKFTAISLAETEKKLDLLNVHARYNIGESFYEWLNLPRPNNEDYPNLEFTMKDIVAELIEKWIATKNEDGSVGVVFPEETKMPSCVLQKKDGTGLYLTSDLAAIKYRLTNGWNPSKIIYSVDVRQQLHLKQAFWIAKQAWGKELWADNVEFFHAFNGFIKLKEGAMSTRHGTVIFLEKLIEEGFEKTKSILEEKWRTLRDEDIQAITIAAIKYSYLAQDREKDVTFDWEKALNFEGNSGPYIQYAFVRAKKIYSEEAVSKITDNIILSPFDKSLIQALAEMNSIIEQVAESYKPHHLALYAYRLASIFNSFYVHTPKILEEKDENLKNFRLSLVKQTTKQLELAFELLGIKMPSEM